MVSMSYDVPSKKYPTAADVDAVGIFLAQRQSDSGTTNGGIAASGGSAVVPQLGVDVAGLGLAYMKAQADAILCAVGFQGVATDQAGLNQSNNTASYTDVFSSFSFTAPISKTYLFHVDLSCFMSGANDFAFFQFKVDGSVPGGQPTNGTRHYFTSLNDHKSISFRVPLALSAGAHTLQLQWKTAGTGTVTTGTADKLFVVVTG